jgi:hypothetical protein
MLRHIFSALLGGYFVAGLIIALNWLSAVDLGGRQPTIAQDAERVLATVQDKRTPSTESADVIDVIIGQALTSQSKSSDNREAPISPSPVAVQQPSYPDRTTAKSPGNDTSTLELRRPQSSRPQSLQAVQLDRGSVPKRTDQPGLISMPKTLPAAKVGSDALPTVEALSRAQQGRLLEARRKTVVQQPSHPDRRTAKSPGNDTGTLELRRPQSSRPQSLQAAQLDSGSLPTVRAINQASTPLPKKEQTGSTYMPKTLTAEQVGSDAGPTAGALSRAQQGRLLETRRKTVELFDVSMPGPSFGGTAEPGPELGTEIDGATSADADAIAPKAIRKVFTLACSLLSPAIAAGKLSAAQRQQISRMQDDYLKEAECKLAERRATRVAKRKIGCRCTAETKEFDSAADVSLRPNAPVPMPKPR